MNAFNMVMIDSSRDRLLVTLIALLLSALVLAEQSAESLTYDDLMKDTIYGGASRWRREAAVDEYDWRNTEDEDLTFNQSSAASSKWGIDNSELVTGQPSSDSSEAGYRLFKIEI